MNSNEKFWKGAITLFVLVYCLAPDLFPGPVDDIVVIILGQMMKNRVTTQTN